MTTHSVSKRIGLKINDKVLTKFTYGSLNDEICFPGLQLQFMNDFYL